MSIIGPRPLMARYLDYYTEEEITVVLQEMFVAEATFTGGLYANVSTVSGN